MMKGDVCKFIAIMYFLTSSSVYGWGWSGAQTTTATTAAPTTSKATVRSTAKNGSSKPVKNSKKSKIEELTTVAAKNEDGIDCSKEPNYGWGTEEDLERVEKWQNKCGDEVDKDKGR